MVLIKHTEPSQEIEIAHPLVAKLLDTSGTPEYFFGKDVELLLEDLFDGKCWFGGDLRGLGLNERFNLLQSCKLFYVLFFIHSNLLFDCHLKFLLLLFLFYLWLWFLC